jgi:hypothetical protein
MTAALTTIRRAARRVRLRHHVLCGPLSMLLFTKTLIQHTRLRALGTVHGPFYSYGQGDMEQLIPKCLQRYNVGDGHTGYFSELI